MINLLVDEAYAFDYLAILYVKCLVDPSLYPLRENCETILKSQLEEKLWNDIINSIEFHNMIKVNKEVFDTVQLARYGNITAKEVDNKNMDRFYAKQHLQKKFFPNTILSEWKS